MKRKEIVLIKETKQNEFVPKIMDQIAPFLSLRAGDRVAIKINLSGAKEIYANTHYETVDSLIHYLRDKFAVGPITVIEGSDGAFFSAKTTWDIFYKFKYKEVEMQGARLSNLDELPHEHTLDIETVSGPQQVQYCRFPSDYLVSVVPPKDPQHLSGLPVHPQPGRFRQARAARAHVRRLGPGNEAHQISRRARGTSSWCSAQIATSSPC